jgi:type IV pilus assembly protein PilB
MSLFGKKDAAQADPHAKLPLNDMEAAILGQLEDSTNGISSAVDTAIVQGVLHGASDIHFDPWPEYFVLRYRIDGIVQEIAKIPLSFQEHLVTRLKVLAKMPLYKRELPLDGRIDADATPADRALRMATLPTVGGEQVVLRVSNSGQQLMTMDMLGFHGTIAGRLRTVI